MSDLDRDGDYDFTRVLDHSARTLGRPTGWDLLDEVGTAENGAVYGYDAATGRLATVAGASAGTFSYAYTADSGLLESVTRQHPDGTLLRNIRTYDSTRDTLATISNRVLVPNGQNGFDTTVRSSYDYAAVNGGVNSIGQRKGVRTTFNPDGTVASKDISWEYDALGQVTSADGPATVADRSYQYDAIGNRIMSSADQSTTDYEADYMPGANFLNQYDTIHTPGDTWFLSHDDDGNLTYGPVPGYPSTDPAPSEPVRGWFVWDAENRLIDATADQYLYYAGTTRRYDPLGRLIWETGGGTGAPGTIYVYDGWNRIAQYALTWDVSTMAPAAALTHTYLWGPDLSGAFQGAGGVGGLLAVNRVNSTMAYPAYDGNGNITEYLDATGGVLAHFEYDPFGNTVVSTDYDNSFAYRFSTKPIDQATGWYYYGYRWYDPLTGRWPSRDPIAERGGINLYGFVGNDGARRVDILGLVEKSPCYFKVCIKIDQSAYEELSKGSNQPFLNYLANYGKIEKQIKDSFGKQTKACLKNKDCCCSELATIFRGPEDDIQGRSAEIEKNLDMEFKDSVYDSKTAGGKRRLEAANDDFFKNNVMGYDQSCSVRVLLTGKDILTPNSSAMGRVEGLTIGGDGVKNDCGNRAIILPITKDIGNVFSHEIGHFIGWWATGTPMQTPDGPDFSHSGDPKNIMSYSGDPNAMGDDLWCSLFCRCAKKMDSKN